MSDNPYQSPASPVSRAQNTGPMDGSGTFTIGRSFSEAWDATFNNLGMVIGVSLACFAISVVSMITIIGYFVVMPVMIWGMVRFGLNLLDGRAQFSDLFSGFTNYGSRLGRMLFFILVMMLVGLVSNIPYYLGVFTENGLVMGIGWVISMVVSLYITLRMYFSIFYMVDQDMGVLEAIQASLDATRKLWLQTFVLALVSGVIGMLGMVALVIGLVVSIPVAYLMWASAYRQIAGRPAE